MYACIINCGFQRDFGVYIVNAFDTGAAAKALNFSGGSSLANVLDRLYGVKKDTACTLEDWRIR